jgi:hypothetical protein
MNTEPNFDLDADAKAAAYALRVVSHVLHNICGRAFSSRSNEILTTPNAQVYVRVDRGALMVWTPTPDENREEIDRFPLSDPLAAAKCALGYCAWQEALAYSEEN